MSHRTYKVFRHTLAALLIAGAMSTSAIAQTSGYASIYDLSGQSYASLAPTGSGNFESIPLFVFPGYTYNGSNQLKIYIPEGTRRLTIIASLPQGTPASAAMRLDTPPTEDILTDYGNEQIFSMLLSGQEIMTQHDGGGTFTIAWGYTGGSIASSQPTTKGHWLYIRFVDFPNLYQFTGQLYVDAKAFALGQSKVQLLANGEPTEQQGSTTTTSPSTSTNTPASGTGTTSGTSGSATSPKLAAVNEATDGSGNLNLNFNFSPLSSDQGKAASVFVLAQTPRNGMFIKTSSGWKELSAFDLAFVTSPIFLDSVKFTSIPSLQASNPLTLSTGLPRSALKDNSVRFYTGYRVDGGALVSLGVLW